MNKKIPIGSIIAVAILVLVTTTSAVNVNFNGDNQPPYKPEIYGPATGIAGLPYEYFFASASEEGDDVWYYIDWGDNNTEDWLGPYDSGFCVGIKHIWNEQGTYMIRAKAKNIYGAESDWGELTVTISKSKQIINPPFLQWLDRFPLLNQLIMRLIEG